MAIMPNMDMVRWSEMGYQWWTVDELAAELRVSLARIYRWHARGKLPSRRIGKRIVFLTKEIDALLPMIKKWLGRPERIQTSKPY